MLVPVHLLDPLRDEVLVACPKCGTVCHERERWCERLNDCWNSEIDFDPRLTIEEGKEELEMHEERGEDQCCGSVKALYSDFPAAPRQ